MPQTNPPAETNPALVGRARRSMENPTTTGWDIFQAPVAESRHRLAGPLQSQQV